MSEKWDYPQPFTKLFTVEDKNIDTLGHTNNGVYIAWCELLAWEHSAAMGLDEKSYLQLERAMAIREANYQYLGPSFQGDTLKGATWLTASDGRLNMQRSFQIVSDTTGNCLFRGRWELTCINLVSNKPARMPKEFKDSYLPHLV